ncbi:MAG TPA: EAL domain-containing protein [Kofleriaceae bacterium]|nr:EAL domain-containing protein [Kofleriaceae bacterium]
MPDSLRVLLIEDNPHDARFVRLMLSEIRPAPALAHETHLEHGIRRLQAGPFDCVLLDLSLPDGNGLQAVRSVIAAAPRVPVVVMTGLDDSDVATAAMRQGAQDYLVKGEFDARLLERALRYAVQRMRTTLALRASEERFALAVRSTAEGIFDWDLAANRVYLSPRWFEMVGLEYRGFLEDPDRWLALVHPDDRARLRAQLDGQREASGAQDQAEYRLLHRDGQYRWMLSRWTVVRGSDGEATRLVGSQADITERRVQDPVTALPNAVLIRERLARALARARFEGGSYRFAVAMVGVDRMKLINDGLGHAAGDDVLARCARRLQQTLRPRDFVGRFGGDEFVVHLEDVGRVEVAIRAARRFQERLAAPMGVGGREVYPTVSVGIVMSDPSYAAADDILRDASAALHRASAIAPGQLQVFDPAMHQRAISQLALEADLRRALERDQLRLHYQPVLDLTSGRASGIEVLLRWEHPDRGLLAPADFIELAEETGLIAPIGDWVLWHACRQLHEWRARDPRLASLVLSVNVSPRQLLDWDLSAAVAAALSGHDVAPDHLQLELGERALLDRGGAPLERIRALRAERVRIALDDFGAGTSSLGLLRDQTLDALKLDRSMVAGIADQGRDRELARAVVAMARNLDLAVVAEGVESEAERAALVEIGCREGQGFLFAPPAGADETLAALLRLC